MDERPWISPFQGLFIFRGGPNNGAAVVSRVFLPQAEGLDTVLLRKPASQIAIFRDWGGVEIAGAAQHRSNAGHGMGGRKSTPRAGFRGGGEGAPGKPKAGGA